MQTLNPGDTAAVRHIVSELQGRPGSRRKLLHALELSPGSVPARLRQ